jgi:hypothetical protein
MEHAKDCPDEDMFITRDGRALDVREMGLKHLSGARCKLRGWTAHEVDPERRGDLKRWLRLFREEINRRCSMQVCKELPGFGKVTSWYVDRLAKLAGKPPAEARWAINDILRKMPNIDPVYAAGRVGHAIDDLIYRHRERDPNYPANQALRWLPAFTRAVLDGPALWHARMLTEVLGRKDLMARINCNLAAHGEIEDEEHGRGHGDAGR